jgi:hypothetical protein
MMKQLNKIFLLLLFIPFINASAQKADSTEMGNGYGNDVYYSFQNGTVKTIANNTWDLAFRTGFRTDGIFINSNNNSTAQRTSKLYLYPNSGISGWNTFDTAGWASWLEYQNMDSSWEFGAFNRAAGAFPDFSWGVYNTQTNILQGDSLYLLKINNGGTDVFKKLHIIDKNFGVWHFRYANVDGTNEVTDSIVGSNADTKLLDYYSIIDEAKVNREPDSVKYWDLLFTRYNLFLDPPGDFYPVMGVFTNLGYTTAKATKIDVVSFNGSTLQATDYKTSRSIIGSDWKTFDNNTFQWKLADSTAYFVKSTNGAIWKIVFTGFGGSGNGRSIFNTTKISDATSVSPIATVASFGVYPNPASSNVSLVFENRTNSVKNTLNIYNIAGKLIETHTLESAPGFYTSDINIAHLPTGVYIMNIENAGFVLSQKLIKE